MFKFIKFLFHKPYTNEELFNKVMDMIKEDGHVIFKKWWLNWKYPNFVEYAKNKLKNDKYIAIVLLNGYVYLIDNSNEIGNILISNLIMDIFQKNS